MVCIVLPLLLTARLLQGNKHWPRWVLTSNVKMEQNALEDAAPIRIGTAVQMVCTVLRLLLTAHLLQRNKHLPRWVLTSNVKMEQNAQEDAAPIRIGTAVQMVCIVLPLLLTVHLLLRRWLLVINICDEVEHKLCNKLVLL